MQKIKGMLITEIFGPVLLPTHEYVGWLKEENQVSFVVDYANKIVSPKPIRSFNGKFSSLTYDECYYFNASKIDLQYKAHTFNDQPMEEGDFVRGEEPNWEDYVLGYHEEKDEYEIDKKWDIREVFFIRQTL